jgi:hypothetical protein
MKVGCKGDDKEEEVEEDWESSCLEEAESG